jgi:rubrerythrin
MNKTDRILAVALEIEKNARDFYTRKLDEVHLPRVRAILEWLRDSEQAHVELVEQWQQQGRPAISGEVASPSRKGLPLLEDLGDPSRLAGDLTILRTAMDIESNARQLYTAAASNEKDPETARFYKWLADWEQEHWNLLDETYREISTDFWGDVGFSPF